jgi:hypothetical protein
MGVAIERSSAPQTDLAKLEQSSRRYFLRDFASGNPHRARKHRHSVTMCLPAPCLGSLSVVGVNYASNESLTANALVCEPLNTLWGEA